mgnify:CR=1 FL=1
MDRRKWLFVANRALLILAVAAILIGLYQYEVYEPPDSEGRTPLSSTLRVLLIDEWEMVLNNARILCLSCIGIE